MRPMFFTYRLAWPCGSIIRGHRRAVSMMMLFSMDTRSSGSSQMAQWRILSGSPSISLRVNWALRWIFLVSRAATHFFCSSWRSATPKAPMYETMPAARTQSPGRSLNCSCTFSTVSVHRDRSPLRAPTSLWARSILTCEASISLIRSSFFLTADSYSSSNRCTRILAASRFSSATRSLRDTTSSSASASLSFNFLGSTARAMW
mmetsp:Transcript_68216/g.156579  ORF Transcript_68216/g.156579 Transcript_68216/m.156579 type:complete len:204 (+) Transcript_68216:3137-3748(+)